ncbi:MAG: Tyrosine--tRNA ligase [Phycisphaerae bacterium]|nr:Tyrosine--tRNA ligase [Phycisphaerae bacterium]
MKSVDEQMAVLSRGCEAIYSVEELRSRIIQAQQAGRPLRAKLGMDPTAPDIHLGHTVVLRKLRQFQDFGHQAVLIIGDYTARIGDPTGRTKSRPMLDQATIEKNAETYFQQAGRVLDMHPEKLEIHYNSEWLAKFTFADVLRLTSYKSVQDMLERENFKLRRQKGQPIWMTEMLYPLMQGWDSVCIKADVELGGTDQTFNNLVGRDLQKMENQPPQIVMVMPILVGLDGVEKMSKSLGNYVGVTEDATSMFGKLMSIPDALMKNYYTLLTEVAESEFTAEIADRPRDAKVRLAKLMVAQYHSPAAAEQVEREFFAAMRGDLPVEMEDRAISAAELTDGTLPAYKLAVLCGFAATNGEARRLIAEGGVRYNQQKLIDPQAMLSIKSGDVVQRGKRVFLRLGLVT